MPPHLRVGIHHFADGLIVEVVNVNPLDSLVAVFVLFSAQYQLHKELLQLLIAVVDTELLKTGVDGEIIYRAIYHSFSCP